jgi:hypothetical protein
MPKTVTAATIDVPGVDTFRTNAVPDPFDARDPGEGPVLTPGESPVTPPSAPRSGRRIRPEVAAAPRTGSPIPDVLQATGWSVVEPRRSRTTKKGGR